MDIKILKNIEEVKKLEKLRYNILDINDEIKEDNYHINKVKEDKMIPFGLYYNEELVAGAYVANERNSLYIDYLFVKKEYKKHSNCRKIIKLHS